MSRLRPILELELVFLILEFVLFSGQDAPECLVLASISQRSWRSVGIPLEQLSLFKTNVPPLPHIYSVAIGCPHLIASCTPFILPSTWEPKKPEWCFPETTNPMQPQKSSEGGFGCAVQFMSTWYLLNPCLGQHLLDSSIHFWNLPKPIALF